MSVRDIHGSSLATSSALSEYYVPSFIAPLDVIRVLQEEGIRFVLVGAHGIGGWTKKPRATHDVDVLVAARGVKKAVTALQTAFPQLDAEDHDVVVRLRDRELDQVVIDVIKPNQPLFREAVKLTHTVVAEGVSYQIPSLEAALAMKLSPMISPARLEQDRHLDAHDFIAMVRANEAIDLNVLAKLGELVCARGGKDIVELVRKVRAGEKLVI